MKPKWIIRRWWKRYRVWFLVRRDGPDCRYCGCNLHRITRHNRKVYNVPSSSWARRLTIDHLVPRSLGGTNKLKNLGLSCATCNGRKGSMSEAEFLRSPRLIKRRASIEQERRECQQS